MYRWKPSLCMQTSKFWSRANKEKNITGNSTKLSLVSKKGYIGLLLTLCLVYHIHGWIHAYNFRFGIPPSLFLRLTGKQLAKINNQFFSIIQALYFSIRAIHWTIPEIHWTSDFPNIPPVAILSLVIVLLPAQVSKCNEINLERIYRLFPLIHLCG